VTIKPDETGQKLCRSGERQTSDNMPRQTKDRKPVTARKSSPPAPAKAKAGLVDVFISYARADEKIAKNVVETLRSEGFEVWYDSRIYAGAKWKSLLTKTLASSKAIVVLWSQQSIKRPWVLKEAKVAMDTGRLVPVKIDDCILPAGFDTVQTAMMPGWTGTGHHPDLERLLAGLSLLAPPSRIDNVRPGFVTDFLGVEVGFPVVTGVAEEFRYLHFSVVMNPARRLAWYVAYNMGPHENVQRGNRWMPDPMLPASFQPNNAHFLGTGFDRGHLAAPLSVSWGTTRQAQLANYQSFFWTNTSPQHPAMNRGWWLAVEVWERNLVVSQRKAIGFSEPVLADDDPLHRDVEQTMGRLRVRQNFRSPRRFWKVVVVADAQNNLRSAAFVLDQDALLKTRFPLDSKPSEFRCTVADIEALTTLDFGDAIRKAASIP
jgi:DNA/RNA endonuclease G (NUC1)